MFMANSLLFLIVGAFCLLLNHIEFHITVNGSSSFNEVHIDHLSISPEGSLPPLTPVPSHSPAPVLAPSPPSRRPIRAAPPDRSPRQIQPSTARAKYSAARRAGGHTGLLRVDGLQSCFGRRSQGGQRWNCLTTTLWTGNLAHFLHQTAVNCSKTASTETSAKKDVNDQEEGVGGGGGGGGEGWKRRKEEEEEVGPPMVHCCSTSAAPRAPDTCISLHHTSTSAPYTKTPAPAPHCTCTCTTLHLHHTAPAPHFTSTAPAPATTHSKMRAPAPTPLHFEAKILLEL